jgi:hypothetical protein
MMDVVLIVCVIRNTSTDRIGGPSAPVDSS